MNNPFESLENRLNRIENLIQQSQSVSTEKILSKSEVVELLGISMNTLDKHIRSGTIPTYGIGNRVLFKQTEILNSLIKIN